MNPVVVAQFHFHFPRDNAEKDVVETNDLRELHRDVQSRGRHHRNKKRAGRDVGRPVPVRVLRQRHVPLAVLEPVRHRVAPHVADD